MAAYPVNVISWPFVLGMMVVDTWLVFAVLSLVARWSARYRPPVQLVYLDLIVDGPVRAMRGCLCRRSRRAVPEYVAWLVTITSVVVARFALAGLAAAIGGLT